MKQMMTIETHSQLKALSDPLRAKIMMRLIEKPYTGQQLSELLALSRAKVHYHLKELEKNKLIEIVKTEEKNGIIQKFYQSVASGFTPSTELLPHIEEISESSRPIFCEMLDRTKSRILSAPEEAFKHKEASEDPSDWSYLASTYEISATEEQFQRWTKKFFNLMEELRAHKKEAEMDPNGKIYHISAFGFQVDEPMFQHIEKSSTKKSD
jgi:DNA-binding transcriptional ArsR family regulator